MPPHLAAKRRVIARRIVERHRTYAAVGGLVPVLALAERAGLGELADEHLSVPTDKGANPGLKVASLVGGMIAGADSIDDMALLRHGGIIAPRRQGKNNFYGLTDAGEELAKVVKGVIE